MHQIAAKFHEEQGDGLGVLAIKNEGDAFSYERYRSTEPHWQTLFSFMRRHIDSTWRFVIHGRYGTVGGAKREHCHPLDVNCPMCDFDYVIHNGSVTNHQQNRASLASHGHDFETKVDSEVIPHKVEELPDSVEDHTSSTYNVRGKLNYLLFSEDGILVKVQRKYDLTDDFTLTCSRRDFDDAEELGFEYAKNEWMLVTPDGADPAIETKERQYSTAGNTSTGSSRTGYNRSGRGSTQTSTWPSDRQGQQTSRNVTNDEVRLKYKDLTPDYEKLTVIKVAPGVLRIKDEQYDEVEFVRREIEPRLYYWYAPEQTPENIETLEEYAGATARFVEEVEAEGEQATLPEFDEGNVRKVVEEATANTLADVAEGDIEELQEQIVDAMAGGMEQAATTGD
jgi:hypothetical protein